MSRTNKAMQQKQLVGLFNHTNRDMFDLCWIMFFILIYIRLSCMTHLSEKALYESFLGHDDVIKCKHSPRNWPFVRRIHRSPVTSPHKGQWRGALVFPLICVWINDWVNNSEAGDLRRYQAHYDVTVMKRNAMKTMILISFKTDQTCACKYIW